MAKKLSKDALEARRAYQREWRRKNPDKVKASLDRHWENVAARAKAAQEAAADPGE